MQRLSVVRLRTLIFIVKLVLLCPLSFVAVELATKFAVGGHGSFLPLLLIMGPLNLLFALMNLSPSWEAYILYGTICLYETYALFLKFIKVRYATRSILMFHIASIVIGLLLWLNGSPDFYIVLELLSCAIVMIPWGLIILVLVSIRGPLGSRGGEGGRV